MRPMRPTRLLIQPMQPTFMAASEDIFTTQQCPLPQDYYRLSHKIIHLHYRMARTVCPRDCLPHSQCSNLLKFSLRQTNLTKDQ